MKELLIGCGSRRDKLFELEDRTQWTNLVTLDINKAHNPTVIHDLERYPWPFDDREFSEVHAYEVVEHVSGQQGDAIAFFRFFAEVYRILEPNGLFCASVPDYRSEWAWGDPSHKRVITSGSLVFLSQAEYAKQVGKTAMSDFRHIWKGDFETVHASLREGTLFFALRAIK